MFRAGYLTVFKKKTSECCDGHKHRAHPIQAHRKPAWSGQKKEPGLCRCKHNISDNTFITLRVNSGSNWPECRSWWASNVCWNLSSALKARMVHRPCSEEDRWEKTGLRAVEKTKIHKLTGRTANMLWRIITGGDVSFMVVRRKPERLTGGFDALDVSWCPQEVAAQKQEANQQGKNRDQNPRDDRRCNSNHANNLQKHLSCKKAQIKEKKIN